VPLLREAGHEAIAVDLPSDDETAGLPEYASLVTGAIGGRDDVVLVAQSLGGFTAPLAAARRGVCALVFVNAMIPVPGETPLCAAAVFAAGALLVTVRGTRESVRD